jgi:hypothetical protein
MKRPISLYHSLEQDQPHVPRFNSIRLMSFDGWKWHTPKLPAPVARMFLNWWAELPAAVLFTFAFSTLVAFLRAYQGQPLPKWPLNLTFNTALSVLDAIFRAPALFVAAVPILLRRPW